MGIKGEDILLSNPRNEQKYILASEVFNKFDEEEIEILFIEKNANAPQARFGLSWFVPSIKKYKNELIQVIVTSFFVQLLGLFNPLLFNK